MRCLCLTVSSILPGRDAETNNDESGSIVTKLLEDVELYTEERTTPRRIAGMRASGCSFLLKVADKDATKRLTGPEEAAL